MKKLILPLVCLSLFFSCAKDGDSSNEENSTNIPSNYVLYNSAYYDLGGPCVIEDYGQWDSDLYNLDLVMASPNMYFDGEYLETIDTLSDDHQLYFELFTSQTMLNSGEYNFNSEASPMTYDIGQFTRFNSQEDLYEEVDFSGTVTLDINVANSSITVDLDGFIDENNAISAHWEGSYNYSDYSELSNTEQEFKKKKQANL